MDLETEAAQRVGTTLCNKWTLERLIGTGGMAAVYVASHKIVGRREAIKILHPDVARDPELRARFEQEAAAVNRFKHPGTVDVRDIDVAEDGSPFMVMELLDGKPLAALAREPGGVPLADLLRMVDEMLDVLAAAHAQGIIHRDIKPDNLFIQSDGRLKVLDFGIARVRAGAPPKLRTRVGATLGTAPYMPPEQILGTEIDARADLFAVGATMFRLIAKRRVHEAANESETLVKMASVPAPPLASAAPDTPRDVCLVVDRALMFDREHRYPDALTMQSDVRALREGRPPPYATAQGSAVSGVQPRTDAAGEPPIPPPPSTRPATAIAIPEGPLTPDAPTLGTLGTERTAAASPGAMQGRPPAESDLPTLTARPADPTATPLDPMTPPPPSQRVPDLAAATKATRPAMMVLGAAGLGAPLNPASSPEPAPSPAPAPATSGERTLRSVQGPEGVGHAVSPQGYSVGTAQMPAVQSVPVPGPRTQLSGVAPPSPPSVPLAPGESIPVLPAPPPPKRRYTVPGTDISVWPLVGVGVVFAAIGVGVTLWYMMSRPGEGDYTPSDPATAVHPTATHAPPQPPPPHVTNGPAINIQPGKGKPPHPLR